MKTREIAEFLGGELHGDGDLDINGVADLAAAGEGRIAYCNSSAVPDDVDASCVIVRHRTDISDQRSMIVVAEPKLAFAKIASVLHPQKIRGTERHPSAVIAESATIGPDVFIGAFVCVGENSILGYGTQLRAGAKVGDNVAIGKNCILHPNVFVEDGCSIGSNVVLHSGVVIGSDGFGYVRDESGAQLKFPQIGSVVIEDNVEIGANSCVDRGALGETRIGEGTKIDNLVQIAHNVRIGRNCIIVAMSGISGSSVLEDNVVLAGQVGIADHVTLKKGVVIAAKSAVYSNKVIRDGIWAGIPARPIKEFNENFAALGSLPTIRRALTELKSRDKSDGPEVTE